jgi:UDP-N-acetylglucosamine diphosphorylase/glucosamine-1-phosphate N-acetyltransferase
MKNYLFFNDSQSLHLRPFTFTRPASLIRVGILTIAQKWEAFTAESISFIQTDYLNIKYKASFNTQCNNVLLNSRVLPSRELFVAINTLKENSLLQYNNTIIAINIGNKAIVAKDFDVEHYSNFEKIQYQNPIVEIQNVWDIFAKNELAINSDFELITYNRLSEPISTSNTVIRPDKIFIEKGAKVECCILNASTGYIYIGKDSEIMEGTIVRGALALCEGATLKLGTKIYGPTTIGPHCKVGGEVNNSVLFGFSNKAHDGFLGNSVIGEWCNLGADTNNSNLKNNYSNVKIHDYVSNALIDTGLQFCGLFMADHAKCGINTMFNTGTVVGVASNVFGADFPPKHIKNFSWGGSQNIEAFKMEKAIELAQRVYKRRAMDFDETEQQIFKSIEQLNL